jgi:hypothetical protein
MKLHAFLMIAWLGMAGSLAAQDVTVGPNLELLEKSGSTARLAFATDSAKIYQFEISGDLEHWDREGYAFRGTGGRMSAVLSNRGLSHAYFRLRDDAPAENAAPYGPYGPYGISSWNGQSGPPAPGDASVAPQDIASPPVLPRTQSRILANRLSGGARAFRLSCLLLGDSYAVDLRGVLDSQVAPVRELGFGPTHVANGGAAAEYERFELSPNGIAWRLDGAEQTVQFPPEMEAYRIKVFYSTAPDGGTFALETSTNGGAWLTVPGAGAISTLSAEGVGAGIISYDFGLTERRRVRAKWVSGTARVLGFVLSDIRENPVANRGGCAVHDLSVGGIEVFNGRLTPQPVWDTILRDIQPDFCTYKALDRWMPAEFEEFYNKVQQAWPLDWVMVSRHPMNPTFYPPDAAGNELVAEDLALRDFALAKGQLFINARSMFPNIDTMIELGMTHEGDVHLTAMGNGYQAQIVMDVLSAALKPSKDNGGMVARADFEYGTRYRRNALGIVGEAGPRMMLDLWSSVNSGVNYRPMFGVSKLDDVETIGLHSGPLNRCFAVIGSGGKLLWNNSEFGWGAGLPQSWRSASAGAEFFAGDRTGMAPLAVSATSAHTGDVFAVFADASTNSPGTRTAGIAKDGSADFGRLKAELPVYSGHGAADADANLKEGQFYKLSTGRAVYQKP